MSTKARWRNGVLTYYDSVTHETILPVGSMFFNDDFLGKAFDVTNTWTALDTAGATETLKGDQPQGVVELALTNANEAQLAGIYMGDERPFTLNRALCFEARLRFTVLPTGSVVAVWGLAGDHNAATDTVAEAIWFRVDGSGAVKVETDDTTTNNDDVATGITVVANAWHIYRFEVDTAATNVRFYIDGEQVAATTTFDVSAVTTLQLQAVARVGKEAGATTVGTMEVDYIRVWQNRS